MTSPLSLTVNSSSAPLFPTIEIVSVGLYPNPTQSGVYIQLPTYATTITLFLNDLSGRLVKKVLLDHSYQSSTYYFPLDELPSSIYTITITDDNSGYRYANRLIKTELIKQ